MVIHKPQGLKSRFSVETNGISCSFHLLSGKCIAQTMFASKQKQEHSKMWCKNSLNNVKCKRSRLTKIIQHEYQLWPTLTYTRIKLFWQWVENCRLYHRMSAKLKPHCGNQIYIQYRDGKCCLKSIFMLPRPVFDQGTILPCPDACGHHAPRVDHQNMWQHQILLVTSSWSQRERNTPK